MISHKEHGFVVDAIHLAQCVLDWNDAGVSMKALGTDDTVTLATSVEKEGRLILDYSPVFYCEGCANAVNRYSVPRDVFVPIPILLSIGLTSLIGFATVLYIVLGAVL